MENYLPSSLPTISIVEVLVLKNVDIADIREAVAVPSVSLQGEDAQRVAALWRLLPTGKRYRCHIPPFGLRFLDGGVVICQASLCWDCNNIFGNANGNAFAYNFDAMAPVSRGLLNECRLAVGLSEAPDDRYRRRMQISKRIAELRDIMQSPYGMEKLMKIWREHYGIPDGQFPPRGILPQDEILRKEFPAAWFR